ncbi:MAG: radical SAM protein [Bacteroidota bacterium]|nr:radical SAM protein [Bacteroidota bacterium]MDP4211049.1 radical SAM protein [Bacteroidota bacterium]MDP4248729.1 radical SAM protein [Bacteroidota bacterium]
MHTQSIQHTIQRYRTLHTGRISVLPVVILMPHSACNCKCVMCDIWKGNNNLKQLSKADIETLLGTLKKFGTQQVVMSGGEAMLNPNFFALCEIFRNEGIKISLLSTGLLLKKNSGALLEWVNDIIVSLDGNEQIHDKIRNIPGAFRKLKEGIAHMHSLNPQYPITGRTVIHRLNFRIWASVIRSARDLGLKQISFLPADVSSQAFNREQIWDQSRQQEILLAREELPELKEVIQCLFRDFEPLFKSRFIAESPEKLEKIYTYYAAFYGMNPFPYKKCNAPWVSTVVEADGTIRPCFFHKPIGNIHETSLDAILNSPGAIDFRRNLDVSTNETCIQCVCYLNLPPGKNPA